MSSDKTKLEQIVGIIGFMDESLASIEPEQESQWTGIFRVSPEEEQYRVFVRRLSAMTTHDAMKAALEMEDPSLSIICAGKFLKALINGLETPILPLAFAVEPFDMHGETDKAVISALLADSLLQTVAILHPGEECASWAATGAQLFALLCHISRRGVTQMNEYNLCVCLLPCVAGTRSSRPEDLMAEQQMIVGFQNKHRMDPTASTRMEAFITYGRRIWGAIFDSLTTLQDDLAEMYRKHQSRQHATPLTRKRDIVMRFIANPLRAATSNHSHHHSAAHNNNNNKEPPLTTENIRIRRPTLIQRAVSHAADRRVTLPDMANLSVVSGAGSKAPSVATGSGLKRQSSANHEGTSFLNESSFLQSAPVGGSMPPLTKPAAPLPSGPPMARQSSQTRPPPVPPRQTSETFPLVEPQLLTTPRAPVMGQQPRSTSQGMVTWQSSSSVTTPRPPSLAQQPRSSSQGSVGSTSSAVKTAAANAASKRRMSREISQGYQSLSSSQILGSPAPPVRQSSSSSRAPSLGDLGRQVYQAASEEMEASSSYRSKRSADGSARMSQRSNGTDDSDLL